MTEQVENTTVTQTTEQTQTTAVPDQTTQTPGEQTATEQTQTTTVDPATAVPESADAYVVEIDGFDFDAFKSSNSETLQNFHAAGMNNKQVEAVVKAFDQHMQVNVEALQQEWGDSFQANINLANQAMKSLGFTPEQMDSPTGFIRLAAAFGKQIQEDLPPSNTQQNGAEAIEQLMLSEAYSNAAHPDHKSVTQRVDAWYAKQYVD